MKTNTTDIKHAAYTAVCSKLLDMAVNSYKNKEEEKLCKICEKSPQLPYDCRCRDCYNEHRREIRSCRKINGNKQHKPAAKPKSVTEPATPKICDLCGKASRRLGSRFCDACYKAKQHENYEKRKMRRAAADTKELCSVCGKAPKLASCSLCRDCLNASRRKLHKERTGITTPKKYRGLCIVCGKNPKLSNMGKCRDCYNAHRRMTYAQLKKAADAAKAGQKPVQVQVMDPVRVEVNNVGCGYVAAILFVLWIITVIGLVFR